MANANLAEIDQLLQGHKKMEEFSIEEVLAFVDELEASSRYGDRDKIYKLLQMRADAGAEVHAEIAIWELDGKRRAAQYDEALTGFMAMSIENMPARVMGRFLQALGQVYYNLDGFINQALNVQWQLLEMPGLVELPLNRQWLARESFMATKAKMRKFDDKFAEVVTNAQEFLENNRADLQKHAMWQRALGGIMNALGQIQQAQQNWLGAAELFYAYHMFMDELRGRMTGAMCACFNWDKARRSGARFYALGEFFKANHDRPGALDETEKISGYKDEYEFCRDKFLSGK